MTLREQVEERERQWRAYHEWESLRVEPERELNRVMEDLSAIWNRLPEDVRTLDPDPKKLGVQRMHRALSVLRTPE